MQKDLQMTSDDLEELYDYHHLQTGYSNLSTELRKHHEAMRVHLLRARIEIEKCKWLETIARGMPQHPLAMDGKPL